MPTRESIGEILRFALPALAAGVASKSGALGGGAFNAFTNNALESRRSDLDLKDRRQQQEFSQNRATEQDRLQSERYRIQDARQATLDKLSMDREQRLIAAEAADQEWRRYTAEQAQKAQARARMSKLTGSLQGAFKNPDFLPMIESQGADKFMMMTDEGPVPVLDAMRELGLGEDPRNLRNIGGLFPPPDKKDDDLQEYTWESSPGVTVTEMLTKQERQAMGRLRRNTEQTKAQAGPKVSVSQDFTGERVAKFSFGSTEIELSRDDVLNLMQREGGYDPNTVDQVMRDPEELQHLLGYR